LDKVGTATLFYRRTGEDYSSDKRLVHRYSTDSNPQTLTFCIEQELQELESIDFHFLSQTPAMPIAYIKILSVIIEATGPDSNSSLALLTARDHAKIVESFNMTGLVFNDRLLGELYVVEDADPAIEYRIPEFPTADPRSKLKFEIALEYLPDKSYIMARDSFLARQERDEAHIRAVESRIAVLEKTSEEFDRYRNSPLWNMFIRAQQLYERLIHARKDGAINACLKVFRPAWWSRRNLNEYERWRTANGYQNRPDE